ncbi:MAG TPA: UbiA family prenyltransferase [Bryobacteraceae bacterium]|nr:UbiA family prenyltransferase [Bryobacteraceae bacterium]
MNLRAKTRIVKDLTISARPLQLLKSGIAVGWGIYCAGGNRFELTHDAALVFIGTILLWAGLYSINDLADVDADRVTVHKRFRPLPAMHITWIQLLTAGSMEIALALGILAAAGIAAFAWGGLLLLNQLAYSFEPFRWKQRFGLDVISAAVLSHGARFALGFRGAAFGTEACLACAALVLWKIAAYLLYRLEDVPASGPRTDTAQILGSRKTAILSAVVFACSLLAFAAYAVRSHLSPTAVAAGVLLYAVAILLYIRFRQRRSRSVRLDLLVFSARAQET